MPEAWQTNAAGPFLVIGDVQVWACGSDRFRVVSADGERPVEGFDGARHLARELAGVA